MEYLVSNPYRLLGLASDVSMHELRSQGKRAVVANNVGLAEAPPLADAFGKHGFDQIEATIKACSIDVQKRCAFRYAWPVSEECGVESEPWLLQRSISENLARFVKDANPDSLAWTLACFQELYEDTTFDAYLTSLVEQEDGMDEEEANGIVVAAQRDVAGELLRQASRVIVDLLKGEDPARATSLITVVVESPLNDEWEEQALAPIVEHCRRLLTAFDGSDKWKPGWVDENRSSRERLRAVASAIGHRYPGFELWTKRLNEHYDPIATEAIRWASSRSESVDTRRKAQEVLDVCLDLPVSRDVALRAESASAMLVRASIAQPLANSSYAGKSPASPFTFSAIATGQMHQGSLFPTGTPNTPGVISEKDAVTAHRLITDKIVKQWIEEQVEEGTIPPAELVGLIHEAIHEHHPGIRKSDVVLVLSEVMKDGEIKIEGEMVKTWNKYFKQATGGAPLTTRMTRRRYDAVRAITVALIAMVAVPLAIFVGQNWNTWTHSEPTNAGSTKFPAVVESSPSGIDVPVTPSEKEVATEIEPIPKLERAVVVDPPPLPDVSLPNDSNITPARGPSGLGVLYISSSDDRDAAVKLVPLGVGSNRYVYIRKGMEGRISDIAEGVYKVLVRSGISWDAAKLKFRRSESLSKFVDTFDFTETTSVEGDRIVTNYSTWSITLYTVADGNAKEVAISEEEFEN
ncbi:MAG: hypothetical protein M3R13_06860 [Armatimonadota bacterium]|nr:hypothetical protein [Armatimonadota bacterium]